MQVMVGGWILISLMGVRVPVQQTKDQNFGYN